MISGFLIVTEKHMPMYYLASEQSNKSLEVSNKVYSGCGRSWDYWLPDSAPANVKKLTTKAEETYSQNLMYSLFSSIEEAKTVLDWVNDSEDEFSFSLLKVYSDKKPDSTAMKHAEFIGVDIDCNGHYPIKEELFASKIASSMQFEFEAFFELLNKNGLFDSYLDAKKFMDCYLRIQMDKNIEKLSEDEISYSFIHEVK
ncbi:hypothetical protein [Shewanella woodyi]|uniref:Uncharacterized protein n=1 Tax=Shewanella woodyi (strain ATCC 51908 / MS32) TaxID=392500 RepID=B1KJS5_SHEWM|nr:hypothetical protein [Shewanella woodyi]ACA85748.1 hypothetical protein Swoo_1460 [Shewanella woodyi ATCC 51908]